MPAMKINEYINLFFAGSKAEFARYMDVTPQQVTKWVNGDWVVSNGVVYSPKRKLRNENIMNEIYFIAKVICGAEYALAEVRNLNIPKEHAEDRIQNAKQIIKTLTEVLEKENYSIRMLAYNEERSEYEFYNDQPMFELGETYFSFSNPGSICFIYNDDIKSERSFHINYDAPRLFSGRFNNYDYPVLVHEIQQTLQTLEQTV